MVSNSKRDDERKYILPSNRSEHLIKGHYEVHVRESDHLYKAIPGWIFEFEFMIMLRGLKVEEIWVVDHEAHLTYKLNFNDIKDCTNIHEFKIRRKPVVLFPLECWAVTETLD